MSESIRNGIEFDINEEDIQAHAPILYDVVRDHQEVLYKLTNKLTQKINVDSEKIMKALEPYLAYSFMHGLEYKPEMLENDTFRMEVIYHLCFCIMTNDILLWPVYIVCKKIVIDTLLEEVPDIKNTEASLLQIFKVSPEVVPKSYLQYFAKISEFKTAVDIIIKELDNVKDPMSFISYEMFFDYVDEITTKLTEKLQLEGLFNYHKFKRFKIIIANFIIGGPPVMPLYNISEQEVMISDENIANVAEQIWTFKKSVNDKDNDKSIEDGLNLPDLRQ